MANYQLVQVAMISSFVFVVILGTATYGYSLKKKFFVTSFPILIYGIAVAILFSFYYLPEVYSEVINYENEKDISKIYTALNILSAEVSYVVLIFYHRGIVKFLNNALTEFNFMKRYVQDDTKVPKISLFGVKALGFPAILWVTITFKQLYYESLDGESTVSHLTQGYMTMIPYMIRSASSTFLYGIMLLTAFYMSTLIEDVGLIVKEINLMTFHKDLKTQKPFYKMQRFCELSDQLDEILTIYSRVMRITGEYIGFVGIPWIASLGCNLIGVTYGIFAQYTYIVSTVFDGEPYEVTRVFTGTIFILVSALEIFLQAKAATENTDLVTKLFLYNSNSFNTI